MSTQNYTFFSTTFTGASNPGLVPVPFTSKTETSGNTIRYDAAGGLSGGPAARVLFAGTSADCYGQVDFANDIVLNRRVFTLIFNIKFGIFPYVGMASKNITLLRVTGADGSGPGVQLYKPAAGTPKLCISDIEHGTSSNGTATLSASTWYEVKLVIDATTGSESLTLYIDGAQDSQRTSVGAFNRRMGSLLIGGINSSGIPVVGVNWDIDSITCTAQFTPSQMLPSGKVSHPMGAINFGFLGMNY